MLITVDNKTMALGEISRASFIGFDTETYGLGWNDHAFMMGFWLGDKGYVIDLRQLPVGTIRSELQEIFADKYKTWFIHNAKFDMHKLALEDIRIGGTVHCTMAIARVLKNNEFSYSLDNCLKRDLGREKNDEVKKYILEHKLYDVIQEENKKKKTKDLHYHKVPNEILIQYQIDDAKDTYDLGIHQTERVGSEPLRKKWVGPFTSLILNEKELTKTCFEIEQKGILLDVCYTEKCQEVTQNRIEATKKEIEELAGEPFISGPKWLQGIFHKFGVKYEVNPNTGNPCFDKHHMEQIDHPIANKIKELRHHENYLRNFYSTFLQLRDSDDVIHANIWQSGTDTGRFSYSSPNLQNVPKEEKLTEDPIVRRCFIPRPEHSFVAIDYDQQEFRMMLDYAGEKDLIRQIVEDGKDVHQATADMMNVSRKEAKTLNFGLLYGMGTNTLATSLGVDEAQAAYLKELYFDSFPKVQELSQRIITKGETLRHVYNWAGRKLRIDDKRFAYKLPNHVIQGGGGDIMRRAMVQIQKIVGPVIVATIHDELLFEIRTKELDDKIPVLKAIMENIYVPMNGMVLTCGVEVSNKSFAQADMEEYGV